MENQLHIALASSKLFESISIENIDLSQIKGNLFTIKEGEILYKEGDPFNYVYFIISGELNLLSKNISGNQKSIIFSENDYLGHDEFLSRCGRHSTVVALRDSYIIGFDSAEINNLIEQNSEILKKLQNSRFLLLDNIVADNDIIEETEISTSESNEPNPNAELLGTQSLVMNDDLDAAMNVEPENFESPDDYEEHQEDFELAKEKNESINEPSSPEYDVDDFNLVDENDENSVSIEPLGNDLPIEEIVTDHDSEDLYLDGIQSEEELKKIDELVNIQTDLSVENEVSTEKQSQLSENSEQRNLELPIEHNSDNDSSELEKLDENDFDNQVAPEYDANIKIPDENIKNKNEDLVELESTPKENDISTTQDIEEQNIEAGDKDKLSTAKLDMIIKAAEVVNSNIKIQDVLTNIVNVAADLVNADRGTLYMVEKEKGKLWSEVAMGDEIKEIQLKIGEGIAGTVAETGEIINIPDASSDTRFQSTYDRTSGYKTNSILCLPINNKENNTIGVLQLLNSKNGEFSDLDEELIMALSIFIALALENANLVEKLLQTERVHSLGKMTNFLINDIKKPILVSKRYAGHLLEKELNPDVKQVLEMMDDQLNHVADLVQTTSSYSQESSLLRATPQNVNEILNDFSNRVDSYLRTSNCTLSKDLDKDVVAKIDIKEFYQCFYQIVRNAVEAMPDGGKIILETSVADTEVKISFSDNGLGINERLLDKIFEPFMTYGKKNGTGLGLSITKKVVEDHGGKISVISTLGEGATFIITLPLANAI